MTIIDAALPFSVKGVHSCLYEAVQRAAEPDDEQLQVAGNEVVQLR